MLFVHVHLRYSACNAESLIQDDAKDDYTYEAVSFAARSVSGLQWEVMDALANRLVDAD